MFRLGDKIDKQSALNISPVVLAFVGDAVYSLFVRERLVFNSDYKTGSLTVMAKNEVNAVSQAQFIKEILPLLTEEEQGVFKRARNTKKRTKSKSASVCDYNLSTGFEALLGFLFVTGDYERLNFLLNKGQTNES